MAGELTTAIGLGAVLKPYKQDDTIRREMLRTMARDKLAKDAKGNSDKDNASLLKSMVVTNKDLYRPFANSMKEVQAGIVNKYNEYKNDGQGNVMPRLWDYYINEAQPKQQALLQANDMAVRYMKDNNGKFVINPEVASSLYSANSAGDFYKKVAEQNDKTLITDGENGWQYMPVPVYDFKRFETVKPEDYEYTSHVSNIGSGLVQVQDEGILPKQYLSQKRESLADDPAYQMYIYATAPKDVKADEAKMQQYIANDLMERENRLSELRAYKPRVMNTPSPYKGSSISIGGNVVSQNDAFVLTKQDGTLTFMANDGTKSNIGQSKSVHNPKTKTYTQVPDNTVVTADEVYSLGTVGTKGLVDNSWTFSRYYVISDEPSSILQEPPKYNSGNTVSVNGRITQILKGVKEVTTDSKQTSSRFYNEPFVVIKSSNKGYNETYIVPMSQVASQYDAFTVDKNGSPLRVPGMSPQQKAAPAPATPKAAPATPKATPATPKAAPKKQKQSDIDKVIEDEFGGIKVSKTKKK